MELFSPWNYELEPCFYKYIAKLLQLEYKIQYMYSPPLKKRNLIKKIQSVVNFNKISESDVCYLFVLIRKVIEDNNLKSEYPSLKFYSDWMLHSNLDRKDAVLKLMMIDDFLAKDTQHPFLQGVEFLFSDFLSLRRLRRECKLFFEKFDISVVTIIEDKKWGEIYKLILEILADCPLIFPSTSKKKAVSQLSVGFTETTPSYSCFVLTTVDGNKKFLPIFHIEYNSGQLEDTPNFGQSKKVNYNRIF